MCGTVPLRCERRIVLNQKPALRERRYNKLTRYGNSFLGQIAVGAWRAVPPRCERRIILNQEPPIPADITCIDPNLLEGDESLPMLECSALDSSRPDFPLT